MPSYAMPDLTPKVVTDTTIPPKSPPGGVTYVLSATREILRQFADGDEAVAHAVALATPVILAAAPVRADGDYSKHGLPAPRNPSDYYSGPADLNKFVLSNAAGALSYADVLPNGALGLWGNNTLGSTLVADTSRVIDQGRRGAFSFQWLRDGAAIPGATSSAYTVVAADAGKTLRVKASYLANRKMLPLGAYVDPIAWNTTPQIYDVIVRDGKCRVALPSETADAWYEGPPGLEPPAMLPTGCVLKTPTASGIYHSQDINGKWIGLPTLSP